MISAGRRQGHRYLRTGRLVLWVGIGRGGDFCAVWWLDRTRRVVTSGLAVKPPWCPPRHTEHHGPRRPLLKLFGWRLLPVYRDA